MYAASGPEHRGRDRTSRVVAGVASLALIAVASMALTACGGSNGTALETPGDPLSTSTLEEGSGTPLPTARITGSHFESTALGYAVDFPEGWTPDEKAIARGDQTTDIFFGPEVIDGVQPNLSVSCQRLDVPFSLEEFLGQHQELLGGVGGEVEIAGQPARVADQAAVYATSTLALEDVALRKAEYLLVTETCAWTITLTTPTSVGDAYEVLFNDFVISFTLLDA